MTISNPSLRHNLENVLKFGRLNKQERLKQAPFKTIARFVGARALEALGVTIPMTAKVFWGEKMRVAFPECVSNLLLYQNYVEEGVSSFLVDQLEPGHTFIDCGAHIGYHSRLARRVVCAEGSVHAFEPTPSTFNVLQKNCQSYHNIYLNQEGLWSGVGFMKLQDYGLGQSISNTLLRDNAMQKELGNKAREIKVPITSIDTYCQNSGITPHMIKIDAEGAENEIIKGGSNTIERARPKIIMEFNRTDAHLAAATTLLQKGYKIYQYKEGQFTACDLNQIDENDIFFLHE